MTNSAKPALSLADLRVQIDQLDSQLLTLLTTPVVYLTVDRWRHRSPNERALGRDTSDTSPLPT